MDNTLDDILSDLRQLLPASLRGAYLDGYVRRRRTPMELLLSRSLPNTHVSASTFDDVRSEIRAMALHPTDEIPFLQEVEQALALGRDTRPVVARAQRMAMRGREACAACGTDMGGSDCPRCSAQEIDGAHRAAVEILRESMEGAQHIDTIAEAAWPRARAHEATTVEMDVVDALAEQEEAVKADRANMPKMQRLRAMAASPPSDLSGWGQRIMDLYLIRMRPVKKLFGARGPTPAQQAEYDAEKKLWESLNRKARAEHKRLLADSNAGLPPPTATPRPTLPSPLSDVAKERHWRESTYRAEADVIADTFNEGAVWQAEAIRRGGTAHGDVVRLSIYPEQRGPEHVVAVATVHDGEVEIDWRDLGLTMAARNEISRRLRSAAATESSDAPSPLRDLIESTEKRALELGAKPARTRSIGRVTSDNPEERRLGEAVRDLRDRSDFDEAVTWLEAAELNIPFDIGERTSELDAVDKIMSEMWASILDTSTIALGGVRGEGRGTERVFYVSPEMIFDAGSLPFLLHRAMDNPSGSTYGPATLKEVAVKIIDPGDDDTYSAKVIDRDKALKNDSMVHANERGAHFIRSLYRNMKLLRDDLERAPKALDDVRKLLYWTGAMLDTPRCQDATHSRALEAFEAAKVAYDQARQHVVTHGTTSSELTSIKAPLRKAAVSAANLATECGEGQVDIFSARPQLPSPGELRNSITSSGPISRR